MSGQRRANELNNCHTFRRKVNARIRSCDAMTDDAIAKSQTACKTDESAGFVSNPISKWFSRQTQKLSASRSLRGSEDKTPNDMISVLINLEWKFFARLNSFSSNKQASTRFAAEVKQKSSNRLSIGLKLENLDIVCNVRLFNRKWSIRFTPKRQINTKHSKRRKLLSFHLRG